MDRKGTRKVAQAYLEFLYTDAAQAIIARHHDRPSRPEAADPAVLDRLPKLKLFTLGDKFGGWAQVQQTHFGPGGVFDSFAEAGR